MTKRFKVAYIIWSLDLGGAEQVVLHLAKSLNRDVFEPVVFCLNEKGRYAGGLETIGVRVIAFHKKPKLDFLLLPRLVQVLKDEKIDLVHAHLFTAGLWGRLAARRAGIPAVVTEHNTDTWKKWFHFVLDRLLLSFTDRMIFVSRKVEEFYSRRLGSLKGKGRVIYNGIDIERFESGKPGLSPLGPSPILGAVGRLVPQKAHRDFVEMICLLRQKGRDVSGLIVGDGPLRRELGQHVKQLGLQGHISFSGFSKDIAACYREMDVFILPSLREGFPMALLEAMASGVPVVATAVGGVEECIRDRENGRLVPVNRPDLLADAAAEILTDETLRARLIKNARKTVTERFTVDEMVRGHEQIYKEVLRPLPVSEVRKVVFVIDHLGWGGAQRQLVSLAKSLSRCRFKVEVISLSSEKRNHEQELLIAGIPLTRVDHRGPVSFSTLKVLYRKFKNEKPDLVYTWLFTADLYGTLAAVLAGVRHRVSAVRCSVQEMTGRRQIIYRWLARRVSWITINAEATRPELVGTLRIPDSKIVTILNGFDFANAMEPFVNGKYRTEWGIRENAPIVAMIARMSSQKDYATFIEAARMVAKISSEVHFVLVGEGPMREDIENRVRASGIRHRIRSLGSRQDTWQMLPSFDICVLATHFEGSSNVILEAMAARRPVIAANVGGNAELITEDETGYLVAPQDPKAMAEAVLSLLQDPEKARAFGRAGFEKAREQFSLERAVQATEKLFDGLLFDSMGIENAG